MSIRSAQAIVVEFVTSNPSTQAALNADSTPVGTLIVNGVDNAASVTVTNIDAGRYKAAVTMPTLAVGDIVELSIAATVSSIAGKAIVWRDSKDVLLDSSGQTTFANTSIATVGSATLAASQHVIVDSGTITTYTGNTPQTGDAYARIGAAGAGLTAVTGVTLAASQHVIVDSGTVTTLSNLPAAPTDWLTGNAVKTDAVTKIQLGLATPTNITAGTITNATNVTNPVTAGTVSDKTGYSLAANQHVIVDSGTVTTLSNLPSIPNNWLTDVGVSTGAVAKIQSGLSTYDGGEVASVAATVNATLVPTGLDAISTTAPTGPATTFREMMVQTWRRLFKGSAKSVSGHTVKTFADNGTTVITTQPWTDDQNGTETLGAAS